MAQITTYNTVQAEWSERKKSSVRETKNLLTDADSKTDTITFFHQEIAGDGHALQGDRLALLFFFHPEIVGDGRALRGDKLALLPLDLLCSPGRIA